MVLTWGKFAVSLVIIFPITEQPPEATVSPAPPEVPSVQVAQPR